ncbi:hypothetical protein EVAR_33642_1 [Eumeta japonica]|uniref:Uncharacterized protein n=1 Tax=Eumeta variegata TaxID=151549 RepID=A0A4C1VPI2_EUMVA|nr:hypothetical protein EVAR_33642_1 [Eumeta japonica]
MRSAAALGGRTDPQSRRRPPARHAPPVGIAVHLDIKIKHNSANNRLEQSDERRRPIAVNEIEDKVVSGDRASPRPIRVHKHGRIEHMIAGPKVERVRCAASRRGGKAGGPRALCPAKGYVKREEFPNR